MRNNLKKQNVKWALFSVDDFTDVAPFAEALTQMGWSILATSETVEFLKKTGIKSQDISVFIGLHEKYSIPPTLHPKIEVALTQNCQERIDLVYDVPYPHSKGNDVGGLTLLALGAKGERIVCFSKNDIKSIISELNQDPDHSTISRELRKQLIEKTYGLISNHYLSLIRYRDKNRFDGIIGYTNRRLESGENPYQIPADLFLLYNNDDLLAIPRFKIKSKANPCFVNIADIDCILNTLCMASEAFKNVYGKTPYITLAAKHGNPCGAAIDWENPLNSVENALMGSPVAVWGGEVIVNFKIDRSLALLLNESKVREEKLGNSSWMLDIIASPGFDEEGLQILSKRPSRKLIENNSLTDPIKSDFYWNYRQVRGGFLRQPAHSFILDFNEFKDQTFDKNLINSLILAWAISWSSNHGGNEVSLVKNGQLIGVGGGPSTVDAARIAVQRARESNHNCQGSVFAANAFFPFTDAPQILATAGCCAGIFPSGGIRETEIKDFLKKENIMIFIVPDQFRGFSRH